MTETIGANIATALVAFQENMPKVHKGKTANVPTKNGGSYRYTYADLADVTAAATPLLTKHGLAFISRPQATDRGYELVGTLVHDSGETITGSLPLHGGSEQAMGSSLTYARRYLMGCLTGIVTDDDEDGALASQTPRQREPEPETPVETARRGIAQAQDVDTLNRVMEWAHSQGVRDQVEQQASARLTELQGGAAA